MALAIYDLAIEPPFAKSIKKIHLKSKGVQMREIYCNFKIACDRCPNKQDRHAYYSCKISMKKKLRN